MKPTRQYGPKGQYFQIRDQSENTFVQQISLKSVFFNRPCRCVFNRPGVAGAVLQTGS